MYLYIFIGYPYKSGGKKELEKASEKANLECDILSQTTDKNRKRVIDGAIQRLSL